MKKYIKPELIEENIEIEDICAQSGTGFFENWGQADNAGDLFNDTNKQ